MKLTFSGEKRTLLGILRRRHLCRLLHGTFFVLLPVIQNANGSNYDFNRLVYTAFVFLHVFFPPSRAANDSSFAGFFGSALPY